MSCSRPFKPRNAHTRSFTQFLLLLCYTIIVTSAWNQIQVFRYKRRTYITPALELIFLKRTLLPSETWISFWDSGVTSEEIEWFQRSSINNQSGSKRGTENGFGSFKFRKERHLRLKNWWLALPLCDIRSLSTHTEKVFSHHASRSLYLICKLVPNCTYNRSTEPVIQPSSLWEFLWTEQNAVRFELEKSTPIAEHGTAVISHSHSLSAIKHRWPCFTPAALDSVLVWASDGHIEIQEALALSGSKETLTDLHKSTCVPRCHLHRS